MLRQGVCNFLRGVFVRTARAHQLQRTLAEQHVSGELLGSKIFFKRRKMYQQSQRSSGQHVTKHNNESTDAYHAYLKGR